MTPIESPDEAEWDAFHEWLDEWAEENNLDPSQAKILIESSGEMNEEIHGNSTEHWYVKAMAYKGIVFEVCEAFRKLGYQGDFANLDTLASRLNSYAESILSKLQTVEKAQEKCK